MKSFNFHTFGDEAVGSSRLRAWKIVRELNRNGLTATVNSSRPAEVEVFQKVRPLQRLTDVKDRNAITIYDFDDNYLLDDVGTRSDVLKFINHCDLVSVGSHYLLEVARPFHDRVVLMENPLDVPHDHRTKERYRWRGRLGWFGNPNNLSALESLELPRNVTTVTRNGHIEWRLETVDDALRSFDLVLIPFELDAWQHAKNANRLLKCLALGVPFLASATPEHRRVAELVGLPELLLVDGREDWESRIVEVEQRYDELPAQLAAARERALEEFSVGAITGRWLTDIETATASAPAKLHLGRSRFADVDVVIVSEDEPGFATRTLRALRRAEIDYRSVTVVSALDVELDADRDEADVLDNHEDLFAIYETLGQVLAAARGRSILLLRAGAMPCRGFFERALATDPERTVRGYRTQRAVHELGLEPPFPTRLDLLLTRPHRPWAVMLPGAPSWPDGCSLKARFSSLAVWELLISLVSRGSFELDELTLPMVLVDAGLASRSPIASYSIFLNQLEPGLHKQLPGHEPEWQRLRATLQAAVIEEHHELFSKYSATIIPALTSLIPLQRHVPEARKPMQSHLWLRELSTEKPSDPPFLVRRENGKVLLLDSGKKRQVSSGLLAAALENLYGPCRPMSDLDLEGYKAGQPAELLIDVESQRVYFVAGGERHQLSGLPLPIPADAGQLRKVKRSQQTLDIARGSVPLSRYNRLLERHAKLAAECERLRGGTREAEESPVPASLSRIEG